MTERHIVVGAGPVGRATAKEASQRGHNVLLVSRSGSGPEVPGVIRASLDASDMEALVRVVADGAAGLYNCMNPPSYDVWSTYWPPLAQSLLAAAEKTGAVLVTAGSLYPYGPVSEPMHESLPDAGNGKKAKLRATMTAQAMQAHREGRIRAVEVRGSDYVGSGVGDNGHVPRVVPRALAGKPVRVLGRSDQLHSFTDVHDMARALVAVAGQVGAWGRVWHAPTNPARTQAETIGDICAAAGKPAVPVRTFPRSVLTVGGLAVPLLRELQETLYQFERPYVLDSSAISREMGLEPSPWDEVCRRTAEG